MSSTQDTRTIEKRERDAFRAGINWLKGRCFAAGIILDNPLCPTVRELNNIAHTHYPDPKKPKEPTFITRIYQNTLWYRWNSNLNNFEYAHYSMGPWTSCSSIGIAGPISTVKFFYNLRKDQEAQDASS